MVQEVVGFKTQFHFQAFCDWSVLEDGKVELPEVRPEQRIASEIPKVTGARRAGRSRAVEARRNRSTRHRECAQIEKVIGQKIFWRVPNQYAQVMKTIHEGDPVAQLSNSEVARNLNEWAGAIGRKPGTEEKKSGILGLWNR